MADRKSHPDRPAESVPARPITGNEVAAYLKCHPDFLIDHAGLIGVLTPPSMQTGESVVDFQKFMVQRLRTEVDRLTQQHRTLLANSRSNLLSQQRVHSAVLAILGATSFPQMLQSVTVDLGVTLDVDVVTLCIESTGDIRPRTNGIQLLEPGAVDRVLGRNKDALLEDHVAGDPALFGGAAGLVKSEALLRLPRGEGPAGLMALGSRDPERFKSGQGTELLCFLARCLGVTIQQWVDA